MTPAMDTTDLPAAVEEYLRDNRAEPFEFAETLSATTRRTRAAGPPLSTTCGPASDGGS